MDVSCAPLWKTAHAFNFMPGTCTWEWGVLTQFGNKQAADQIQVQINSILRNPLLPSLAKAIWFDQVILNCSAKSIALQ